MLDVGRLRAGPPERGRCGLKPAQREPTMKSRNIRFRRAVAWWESYRLQFNGRILFGFAIGWLGMAGAAVGCGADWDRNVFFATRGLLGALRLLALVVVASNLIYFVGPAAERLFSLDGSSGFRRILFTILWGVPVCLMLAFAVFWVSDVLQHPWSLDGGQPE